MTGPDADVVFLSIDEPDADELYARLVAVFGPVKWLHGVLGMRRAYALTAAMADSELLLLADADLEIDPGFDPATVTGLPAGVSMRVWRTVNAVNGLSYGHGGLKLCRRDDLARLGETVDVLASLPGRTQFVADVAGRTRFNQSALHAWRAGFRECAMLARGCEYGTREPEARERLAVWTSTGTGPFAEQAIAGARAGVAFAQATAADDLHWQNLNDPQWLAARYAATQS